MSSSRSIAAARQRRGVESAPPIKQNNYVSANKDNMNNNSQGRVNYRTTNTNIFQDNQPVNANNGIANPISKLSVSDAFALVTIRLGRVELIINKLQSEGILDSNNNINNEKINNGSSSTNFDDTILQNIITRLDGLDKKTVSNDLNQKLQSQYNYLQEEIKQTKDMMMKMQSFIMDNSQKLNTFITNQESINVNQESINEEFFDLRDNIETTNNNLEAVNSIDKLNINKLNDVIDLDTAIKYNIDNITNVSVNTTTENEKKSIVENNSQEVLQYNNEIVENDTVENVTIENVTAENVTVENVTVENIKEMTKEITNEALETTSKKNKNNRNKSINLDL